MPFKDCRPLSAIDLHPNHCSICEVCCTHCNGQCVSRGDCNTGVLSPPNSCPGRRVCCAQLETCPGVCIPWDEKCQTSLLVVPGACPAGQQCCKEGCDGQCVPRASCYTEVLAPPNSCAGEKVCCRPREKCPGDCIPVDVKCKIPILVGPMTCRFGEQCCKEGCHGQCVSPASCTEQLPAPPNSCPGEDVCCKPPPEICPGVCIPFDVKCENPIPAGRAACQADEQCCKEGCGGQCVSRASCNTEVLAPPNSCPGEDVCCRSWDKCPGDCIPFDVKCENPIPAGPAACQADEQCCKEGCGGQCVSRASCNTEVLAPPNSCPEKDVCCRLLEKCSGVCIPLDLRCKTPVQVIPGACPADQQCCKEQCDGRCGPSPCTFGELPPPNSCPDGDMCCDTLEKECLVGCYPPSKCKAQQLGNCPSGLTCCAEPCPNCGLSPAVMSILSQR